VAGFATQTEYLMTKTIISTEPEPEKTVLVGVALKDQPHLLELDESLAELTLLAETAGLVVVGALTQKLEKPNPATFIGPGKVTELKELLEELTANVVVFDDELSPRHQRELEKALGQNIKLLDRTALILDIFAQRARTHEGSLQVELAQYEYRYPRLTRMWTHLARQTGSGSFGGVGLRGPGETQLEVDRREIGRKIAFLKGEIEKVRAHRSRHRQRRRKANVPAVALAGYTNAGKSTLLQALTMADVYIADQLFATLDPTVRRIVLPDGQRALLSDTVGFIQKLPTGLIAAFRATLEEIAEADLILHVVDVSHPNAMEHIGAVEQTLGEINAERIPTVMVFNKIDKLQDIAILDDFQREFPDSVAIAAVTGYNCDLLLETIQNHLESRMVYIHALLPYQHGQLVSIFHEEGQVEEIEHREDGVWITGSIPKRWLSRFTPFTINTLSAEESSANFEGDDPFSALEIDH